MRLRVDLEPDLRGALAILVDPTGTLGTINVADIPELVAVLTKADAADGRTIIEAINEARVFDSEDLTHLYQVASTMTGTTMTRVDLLDTEGFILVDADGSSILVQHHAGAGLTQTQFPLCFGSWSNTAMIFGSLR